MKRRRFDRFVVDSGRRELFRGEELVKVSPKAFHLLELLIAAAPNAVSRDELYQGLWPDTFVDDANLPNLVKELRKALEDDSRNPRFIRTLHGFGYAFKEVPLPEEGQSSEWAPFVLQWSGRDFPLRLGRNVIGRDVNVHVRVDSAGVSRHHAVITARISDATLEDLGSKNGTYLNDVAITAPASLTDPATIRLGSATLRMRRIAAGETTMTVDGSSQQDDS